MVTTDIHISTIGLIKSNFTRSVRNGAKFLILSNKTEVFLEFGLTCTKLMRARFSWSIVQAVKSGLQIPEIKFDSFE